MGLCKILTSLRKIRNIETENRCQPTQNIPEPNDYYGLPGSQTAAEAYRRPPSSLAALPSKDQHPRSNETPACDHAKLKSIIPTSYNQNSSHLNKLYLRRKSKPSSQMRTTPPTARAICLDNQSGQNPKWRARARQWHSQGTCTIQTSEPEQNFVNICG